MGPRRRRVTWTEAALRALDSSVTFVAEESIEAAVQLLERVLEAADSLETLSERSSVVQEHGDPKIRQLLVGPLRLLYRVSHYEVFILGIVHQRRDVAAWRDRDSDLAR